MCTILEQGELSQGGVVYSQGFFSRMVRLHQGVMRWTCVPYVQLHPNGMCWSHVGTNTFVNLAPICFWQMRNVLSASNMLNKLFKYLSSCSTCRQHVEQTLQLFKQLFLFATCTASLYKHHCIYCCEPSAYLFLAKETCPICKQHVEQMVQIFK